jgi:DNA-binding response OmpR family regulator
MNKTLLIVDDDKRIREILKQGFLCLGYQVLTAENGEEGERAARESLPSLVILDVMMPIKNGYEACAALKRDPATAGIPVILLTAKTKKEDVVGGYACGADAYVTKPYDPVHLEALVKQLIAEAEEGKHNLAWTGLLHSDRVLEESEARREAGGEPLIVELTFPDAAREDFLRKSGQATYRDLVHTLAWAIYEVVLKSASAGVVGQGQDDSFLILIHPSEAEKLEVLLEQATAEIIDRSAGPQEAADALARDKRDPKGPDRGTLHQSPPLRLVWKVWDSM